jgi:hypothetical protein
MRFTSDLTLFKLHMLTIILSAGSFQSVQVIFVELSREAAQKVLDHLRRYDSKHGTNV